MNCSEYGGVKMALENRLGITDSAELARTEEKISKQKALKLFETGILDTLTHGTSGARLTRKITCLRWSVVLFVILRFNMFSKML